MRRISFMVTMPETVFAGLMNYPDYLLQLPKKNFLKLLRDLKISMLHK